MRVLRIRNTDFAVLKFLIFYLNGLIGIATFKQLLLYKILLISQSLKIFDVLPVYFNVSLNAKLEITVEQNALFLAAVNLIP